MAQKTRTWRREGVEVHGARAVVRSLFIVVQIHPSFLPSRANLYLPWAKNFAPAQATTLAVSLACTNARCVAVTSVFRNLPKPSRQYLGSKIPSGLSVIRQHYFHVFVIDGHRPQKPTSRTSGG
ncbi:unnamed protein product [Ectocarpus sp. 8 AP-2014]